MPTPTIAEVEELIAELLSHIENSNTRAMYRKGLADFLAWWRVRDEVPLDHCLVRSHIESLINSGYAPATVNQRLAAIRKLASAATAGKLLERDAASGIIQLHGVHGRMPTLSTGLDSAQTELLINSPDPSSFRGLRDRAILATFVGCGLTRNELAAIRIENITRQQNRWAFAGITGRAGRVRRVAIPGWTRKAVAAWLEAAAIQEGYVFRAIDRHGLLAEGALSAQSLLPIVVAHGRAVGLDVTPDDLRRTCAHLCRAEGGDLEEIQLMLGHSSIQTTGRFLGARRRIAKAPNDRVRMKWYNRKLAG